MRPRKRLRFAFAAWLGIFALAIQALIPALLAAEIDIADHEGGSNIFTLCAFGHPHVATRQDEQDGKNTPQPDDGPDTICPICIALLASPAFTAPAPIAVPLPVAIRVVAAPLPAERQLPVRLATASYRSRAPPIA
jgi:hypothetical protein